MGVRGLIVHRECIKAIWAMTLRRGNANVVPTLDLAVFLPCDSHDDGNEDNNDGEGDKEGRVPGMVGGNDYLDHRCSDASVYRRFSYKN